MNASFVMFSSSLSRLCGITCSSPTMSWSPARTTTGIVSLARRNGARASSALVSPMGAHDTRSTRGQHLLRGVLQDQGSLRRQLDVHAVAEAQPPREADRRALCEPAVYRHCCQI